MRRSSRRNPWPKEQRCQNCDEYRREIRVTFSRIDTGELLDKAELCAVCAPRTAVQMNCNLGKLK